MMDNIIYVSGAARISGDLTFTYTQLYESMISFIGAGPVKIEGIQRAIETLLPSASIELKEQARQDFINFVQEFSEKTGLNVIEIS